MIGVGHVRIAFSQTEGMATTHPTDHSNFCVQKFPFTAAMVAPILIVLIPPQGCYAMHVNERHYGYGSWEYRYVCRSCGHAVRPPKNTMPCSVCGGDFAPDKVSMRKIYLEPEKPLIVEKEEYLLEPTFVDKIKAILGVQSIPRYGVREIKRRPNRQWRWQTHAEVEEESGIMRHDDFI